MTEQERWEQVLSFKSMIYITAKNYCMYGIDLEELIQEAFLYLYLELPKFDPNRGMKISSFVIQRLRYFYWQLINENNYMVHMPREQRYQCFKIEQLNMRNFMFYHRNLTSEELAVLLELPLDKIELLSKTYHSFRREAVLSLEELVNLSEYDEDSFYKDLYPYFSGFTSDEDLLESYCEKEKVETILNHESLSDKERETLLYRFGFYTGCEETFETISNHFDETLANSHKRYKKTIKKLQENFRE